MGVSAETKLLCWLITTLQKLVSWFGTLYNGAIVKVVNVLKEFLHKLLSANNCPIIL